MRKLFLLVSLLILAAVSLHAGPNAETSSLSSPEPGLLPAAVHPAPDAGSKLPPPWAYVASLPDGGGAYTRWSYNGSCASHGRLWMVGGRRDASWTVLNHVGTYDPATDTWDDTKPVLNQPRVYLTAAGNNQHLYALGGRDPAASTLYSSNERLESPAGLAWTYMSPLPEPRVFGASVIYGRYLYYLGGTSDASGSTLTTSFWRYDLAADTAGGSPWDTTLAQLPAPMYMMEAVPLNGKIYVPGDDTHGYTYIYDIAANAWDSVSHGPMLPASQYKALTIGQRIWRIGGIISGASSAEVWEFEPKSATWSQFLHPMQQTRISFGAGLVDSLVVAAGGVAFPGFTPTMTAEVINVSWMLPRVAETYPADGATGFAIARPLMIAFTQPVDTFTFALACNPDPGGWQYVWNAACDTVYLHHSRLDYGTTYTVEASAASLIPGSVPNPFSFTTWEAPEIIQSQMDTPGATYASQIFGDYPSFSCYLADDINLTGMDSVKVTAIELVGGHWNGHTLHPFDSLYLSLTTDSSDFPAWSQGIWDGFLPPDRFDATYDGVNFTYILYLDPPVTLANGKSWMSISPFMNFSAKDGQVGWAVNDPAVIYGSAPAWINPGGGFGVGSEWGRASIYIGMSGDGVWRVLGRTYPTGVAGEPVRPIRGSFFLMPNHPNPASGKTTFSFSLPKASEYSLKIYNIAGQMVENFSGRGQAGVNRVIWNASRSGAGVYFYQLVSGGQSATRKLVVVK